MELPTESAPGVVDETDRWQAEAKLKPSGTAQMAAILTECVHADWRTLESRSGLAGDWESKLDRLLGLHTEQALDILAQTVGSHGRIRVDTRYAIKATAAFHGRRAAEQLLAQWIRDDSLAIEDRLFAVDGLASIGDEHSKELLNEMEPDTRLGFRLREAVIRVLTPAPPPEAMIRQWINPGYLVFRSAMRLEYLSGRLLRDAVISI